jgi:hypothetical protein
MLSLPVYLPITMDVALDFKSSAMGDFGQWLRSVNQTVNNVSQKSVAMCKSKYKSAHEYRTAWQTFVIAPSED